MPILILESQVGTIEAAPSHAAAEAAGRPLYVPSGHSQML